MRLFVLSPLHLDAPNAVNVFFPSQEYTPVERQIQMSITHYILLNVTDCILDNLLNHLEMNRTAFP